MEIIIKHYWNEETRKKQIKNFIKILALDLQDKCKTSTLMSEDIKVYVDESVCYEYIKSVISPYLKNMEYGLFKIDIYEKDVLKLSKIIENKMLTNNL